MSKPRIFVSCGQFTNAEKKLGEDIVALVKAETGHDAFFAQQVRDLNGLHENILQAIRKCVGFIAVMHPRGEINRPHESVLTRASVWIEQEIAIAAYIKYADKKTLPVIAFIHQSINMEGIRTLLHLNPISFTQDDEVLAKLPALLESWKTIPAGAIRVELQSTRTREQDGHQQFRIDVYLVNETSRRIEVYDARFRFPARLLKHWSNIYVHEVQSGVRGQDPLVREFRYNQDNIGPIVPRSGPNRVTQMDYCLTCGQDDAQAKAGLIETVYDDVVEATVWVDEQEYLIKKTLGELHREPFREVPSLIAPRH